MPFGCGAFGAESADVVFFWEVDVRAVVETAEENMKIPASAMVLSIGFSCGVVLSNDAGPSTRRTMRRGPKEVQQPANQRRTPYFRGK